MRPYDAEIDPSVCIGAQMCVSIAPENFQFDPEAGVSRAVGGPSDNEGVLEAAGACPVQAIAVRDANTGEPVLP